MSTRNIKQIIKGRRAMDGAGVRLVRVVGHDDVKNFDPFLMLDAFDSMNPDDYTRGFPWHPHRGIETITYLIQGEIEHGDSLGNHGVIKDGDCQWMTAGSGIVHQEMPIAAPRMLGAQLWLNLPKKDKMTNPAYNDIKSSDIPVIKEENATIRVISGAYKDTKGAFEGAYIKPIYLDVTVNENSKWTFDTNASDTLFIYIVEGEAILEENSSEVIEEKQAVLFGEGNTLSIETQEKPIRFLLLSATPLKEPIAWGGPIVMNTEEELREAFMELDLGTFVK